MDLPGGIFADTFGRALGVLLPQGQPGKTAALAGPGLPAPEPAPDITLMPQHPQTGKPWQSDSVEVVPLPVDVWRYLAFPSEGLPVPATGGMPDGVLRDDPLPLHPWRLFWPDARVFLDTLARLPAVRQPWLREIYDWVTAHGWARPS